VAIFGAGGGGAGLAPHAAPQAVTVDGVRVPCGVVETREPDFDPESPAQRGSVLVRVRAVSCNYRDRGFFYAMRLVPPARFSAVGSEFAGEVVRVGADVRDFRPGDRVAPNQHYTGGGADAAGVREGVATNQASREYQVLPARKLVKVPDQMSHEVAATFALNAQTAYSMVRKTDPAPGERVLVTAGTSSTSLFAIAALRARGISPLVTTTRAAARDRLEALGAAEVVVLPREGNGTRAVPLARAARSGGGFDVVVDPFYDLHLEKVVPLMNPFGRYITCGMAGQNPNQSRAAGVDAEVRKLDAVMPVAILRNLSILGNCVGLDSDLARALDDYRDGRLEVVLDSVFGGDEVAPFFERTFNDPARFGKVAYRF
jgi:NADPH:quinone reductase-like Zn-dependent oxidoreductase